MGNYTKSDAEYTLLLINLPDLVALRPTITYSSVAVIF